MKVLLSAYSCDPFRGSEPGVGWNWAAEIARRGHSVHVITRAEHRDAIAAAGPDIRPAGLHFHFHETVWPIRSIAGIPGGVYPHIYAWQWTAARLARRLHAAENFDLVQHITYATARFPSFMGQLGIPFLMGPVGGGEHAPRALRRGLPVAARLFEDARDIANRIMRFDPFVRTTMRQADRVLVKTRDTLDALPEFVAAKASQSTELGMPAIEPGSARPDNPAPRLLFVGRFIHVKGLHIGLPAFRHVLDAVPEARLTLVGQGPAGNRWRRQAERLGIAGSIDWVDWVDQQAIPAIYRAHDLFLFPSLHDSGATVTYEACAYGCPVVCFDLGGPAENLNNDVARIVPVAGLDEDQAARRFAEAVIALVQSGDERRRLAQNASDWASHRRWADTIGAVYEEMEAWLEHGQRGRFPAATRFQGGESQV